ncbi:hypothetical protein AAG906_009119 [Vitis piasezkii]
MKRKTFIFLIASLHMMTWVAATNSPSAPDSAAQQQEQFPESPKAVFHSKQGLERRGTPRNGDGAAYRGLSTLGSRPPNCNHKCQGCIPCDAVQIPTTTDHIGVQYANYEPEGWKCKCGSSLFNP